MQNPKLVEGINGDLKEEFFERAFLGPFPTFVQAMNDKNSASIASHCVQCGKLLLSAAKGPTINSLNDARMKMQAFAAINTYGLSKPFKLLSDESIQGILDSIKGIRHEASANAAKIFLNALMQYRN